MSGTPRNNAANDIIGECSGPVLERGGGGWGPEGINKVTRHQASLGNVTTARSSLLYLLLVVSVAGVWSQSRCMIIGHN